MKENGVFNDWANEELIDIYWINSSIPKLIMDELVNKRII